MQPHSPTLSARKKHFRQGSNGRLGDELYIRSSLPARTVRRFSEKEKSYLIPVTVFKRIKLFTYIIYLSQHLSTAEKSGSGHFPTVPIGLVLPQSYFSALLPTGRFLPEPQALRFKRTDGFFVLRNGLVVIKTEL